jgi:hypothetical protein
MTKMACHGLAHLFDKGQLREYNTVIVGLVPQADRPSRQSDSAIAQKAGDVSII